VIEGIRFRHFVRAELARHPCWECGYSLIGLSEPRCPECGTPFDPAEYERIDAALAGEDESGSDGKEMP